MDFNLYNKTLRSYSESVATGIRNILKEIPVIIAKRDKAMGELSKKSENRKINLPFVSVHFTGSVEVDLTRYNYYHHRVGQDMGFKDETKTSKIREQRYPLLLPVEINFWGKDSDITYGLFSTYWLHHTFDPFITVQDREINTTYRTLSEIISITDQSQDIDENTSGYYNITMELQIQAFFKLINEVKTVMSLRTVIMDLVNGDTLDDIQNFEHKENY